MFAHQIEAQKTEMVDKARNSIILCFMNIVLKEVSKEKIAASKWVKHEAL